MSDIPDDAQETIDAFANDITDRDSVTIPTGPMADDDPYDDVIPVADVRAHRDDDERLGAIIVVEVELDMQRDEYYEALIPEDKARRLPPSQNVNVTPQRSFGEGVYHVMAEHGIRRPDGTPELGVKMDSYYEELDGEPELRIAKPVVQGYIPLEGDAPETDGGAVSVTAIDTSMTIAAFLTSLGAAGMSRILTDLGEEYSVKNNLDTVSLDVGVYDDASVGTTGETIGDTSDLPLSTEPNDGNYARQTEAFSAADISGNWGIDNDTVVNFDVTNTSGTVDTWFTEVNFTAVDTGDSGGTDHLVCTGALSQEYDLTNLTDLDIDAGDGAGSGVGWTVD